MTYPFLLDTNTYFLLFQSPRPTAYYQLRQKIQLDTTTSFYISEITSMEIYAVLGKYSRSSPTQSQICNRDIIK